MTTEADRYYRQRPKPSNLADGEKLRRWREKHFGPRGSLATPRESWRLLGARDETAIEATDEPIRANQGAEKGDSARADPRLTKPDPSPAILEAMAPHTRKATER